MSDFEEYIKVNYPRDYERQKRIYPDQSMEGLYSEDYKMWQHQQAKIEKLEIELSTTKQVLGNVIDMEVAKVDDLKAQLNNMEACYIEKKKEVEGQQKRIDDYEKLTTSIRNEFDLWSDDSEFADVIEAQIENLEALRGAND